MGGFLDDRRIWVATAVIAGLAAWWLLDTPRPPARDRAQPAVGGGGRRAGAPNQPPERSLGESGGDPIPAPSETGRRRSAPPPRATLSARHGKALQRLREGGEASDLQGAFLALLHPYTSDEPLRAGLAILGGRPDELQREVFSALRTRLRPEAREALERLAASDPSPPVRRSAGLALETIEGPSPDSGH